MKTGEILLRTCLFVFLFLDICLAISCYSCSATYEGGRMKIGDEKKCWSSEAEVKANVPTRSCLTNTCKVTLSVTGNKVGVYRGCGTNESCPEDIVSDTSSSICCESELCNTHDVSSSNRYPPSLLLLVSALLCLFCLFEK